MLMMLQLFRMIVRIRGNYLLIYANKKCSLLYLWFLILQNISIFNDKLSLIIDKNKISKHKKLTFYCLINKFSAKA